MSRAVAVSQPHTSGQYHLILTIISTPRLIFAYVLHTSDSQHNTPYPNGQPGSTITSFPSPDSSLTLQRNPVLDTSPNDDRPLSKFDYP
jgi:hypothetical protein